MPRASRGQRDSLGQPRAGDRHRREADRLHPSRGHARCLGRVVRNDPGGTVDPPRSRPHPGGPSCGGGPGHDGRSPRVPAVAAPSGIRRQLLYALRLRQLQLSPKEKRCSTARDSNRFVRRSSAGRRRLGSRRRPASRSVGRPSSPPPPARSNPCTPPSTFPISTNDPTRGSRPPPPPPPGGAPTPPPRKHWGGWERGGGGSPLCATWRSCSRGF